MPSKASTKKNQEVKEEKNSFEVIDGEYAGMKLKGRLYPAKENKGIKRAFMYLEIVPGFNIQCHYVETSNNYFIAFPQYEKDGSYKSYVYVEKDSDIQKALDALADAIYNVNK